MSPKKRSQHHDATAKQSPPRREAANVEPSPTQVLQDAVIRRAALAPDSLTRRDVLRLQRAVGNRAVTQLLSQAARPQPPQKKENETGLPDGLKAGVENLSGMSMDEVRVHYNASEPARLRASAFARGTDIHVAPGQEKHLAHEAWHVVQQKQGRVRPSGTVEGAEVNDEQSLEQEAELLGERALRLGAGAPADASVPRADADAVRVSPPVRESLPTHGLTVQRWSVAAIDEERERLKNKFGGSAALHHIVSKDTLADIAKEVSTVSGYTGAKARAWRETKAAAAAFSTAAFDAWKNSMPAESRAQTGGKLKETLQNLPFNLEAGPEEPLGDAQTGLDVNTTERTGTGGEKIREVEPVSAELAAMSEQWRLYQFHARQGNDESAAAALKSMTTHITKAAELHDTEGMKEPITSQWFTHRVPGSRTREAADRQTRKRTGTYYGADDGAEKFREARDNPDDIPDLAASIEKSADALHMKANGKTKSLPLTVTIDQDAFDHVYQRHSYQHFDFDGIKLVNAFFPYGTSVEDIKAEIEALAEKLVEYLRVEIGATNWKDAVEESGGFRTWATTKVFAMGTFQSDPVKDAPGQSYFDDEMTSLSFSVDTIAPQAGDNYTTTELTAIKDELGL